MSEIITENKLCTKCGIEKEISMFFIDKAFKDGHKKKCKECCKKVRDLYVANNKEKIASYYKNKRDEILAKQEKNKYLKKEYDKEYRRINKEKRAKEKYEYYIKNKEIILQYHRKYRKTEKGKATSKNQGHKRRTLKKQGDVTTNQLLELQQNAKVCYWCNESLRNKKTHIDHYVPLSKGGEHTLSNLVISCAKCNHKKSAIDPLRFANTLGRLL